MKEKKEKIVEAVVALILCFPILLLKGYIFSSVWRWFIVPPFNAPELPVGQAIGILIVSGIFKMDLFLKLNEIQDIKLSNSNSLTNQITLIVAWLVFWGMSALFHIWI